MSQNLNQRYIQIARACLSVLNNVNPAIDRQKQIEEVHAAIEQAIGELYKQQEKELGQAFTALRAISNLSPDQHTLNDAIKLASHALPATH